MILYDEKITLEWNDISRYRDFFASLMDNCNLFKKEKIGIIVMVISELLENVVKYTLNKSCYLKIWFEELMDGNFLTISLENDFSSVKYKDFINLVKIVKEINNYEDYEKMYFDFIQKFLDEPEGKSQFGMALIRKLLEGNAIEIKRGKCFERGFEIRLLVNL